MYPNACETTDIPISIQYDSKTFSISIVTEHISTLMLEFIFGKVQPTNEAVGSVVLFSLYNANNAEFFENRKYLNVCLTQLKKSFTVKYDLRVSLHPQIFWPSIRNIFIPVFLNCWLAKCALENMIVSQTALT